MRFTMFASFVVLLLGSPASAPAQTTQPADSPLEFRLSVPPRDAVSIEKLVRELAAELKSAPSTQPATSQPTTRPDAEIANRLDGWRIELRKALTELDSQLHELLRLTQALESGGSDSDVAKLTKQIADWNAATEAIQKSSTGETDVTEVTKSYEQNNQALEDLIATQTRQESSLKDGFKTERDKLKADLAAATAQKETLMASYEVDLKAADTDAKREIATAQRRAAAARVASLEAARLAVELKERVTQQELERNHLRAKALQPYVAALRQRMTALTEEKSRTRAERLRRRLESPDVSPTEKAFIRLQLHCEENTVKLQQTFAANIDARFTEAELKDIATELDRDNQYWIQFAASLSRRTTAEVLAAHAGANREEEAARNLLERIQGLFDQTISEQRTLEDMESEALDAFDVQAADFRKLANRAAVTDQATVKMSQEVGQLRIELRNNYEKILNQEQIVLVRLKKALDVAGPSVALWEQAVSRLYWSHLITRQPHYLNPSQYAPLQAEIIEIRNGLPQQTLLRAWNSSKAQLKKLEPIDWLMIGLSGAGILLFILWLLHIGAPLVTGETNPPEGAEPEPLRFVQRLSPRAARTSRIALPLLLPALALGTLVYLSGMGGAPMRFSYSLAGLWICLVFGMASVEIAFRGVKTRFRVIPCSGVVARHYLRWARVLFAMAVLLLVPGRLLEALHILPATSSFLQEAFKLTATLAVLCFIVRRETVLNAWPRAQRGRFAGTLTALYTIHPLIVLVIVGMLAARVAGYSALADYVSLGLLTTSIMLIAASLVYQFMREIVLRMARHIAKTREAYAGTQPSTDVAARRPEPAQISPATAAAAGPEMSGTARLALLIARWVLGGAALVAALTIWGIRPYEIKRLLDLTLWEHNGQSITLWRIGGGIIVIFATAFVSRGLRQTLRTRFYPHHPGIDLGAQAAIDTLLHYTIVFVGIYVALETIRLDLGALAVLFGGLGLGLGLGLQPLIVNFVSGLMMLLERQIKVGDIVAIDDKQGEIVSISMRSTIVHTADGLHIVVPNGEFINKKVENWTLGRHPIRGVLEIAVTPEADPKAVRQTLLEIAEAEPRALFSPSPEVYFKGFGDGNLQFSLACWYKNTADRFNGMVEMRYAILKRFRESNINIPYSTQKPGIVEVRVRNDGIASVNALPEPKDQTTR